MLQKQSRQKMFDANNKNKNLTLNSYRDGEKKIEEAFVWWVLRQRQTLTKIQHWFIVGLMTLLKQLWRVKEEEKTTETSLFASVVVHNSSSNNSSRSQSSREINKIYSDVNASLFNYSLSLSLIFSSSVRYSRWNLSFNGWKFFRLCVPRWHVKNR